MLAWETAQLVTVGAHQPKKFPTDLARYLDPPRTRKLTAAEAVEHQEAFEAMKAASDKIPVRPGQ